MAEAAGPKGKGAAIVAAVVSVVVSVSTVVYGYMQQRLAQEQFRQSAMLEYLKLAVDDQATGIKRKQVLQFLVTVWKDEPLHTWAQHELELAVVDATAEQEARLKKAELDQAKALSAAAEVARIETSQRAFAQQALKARAELLTKQTSLYLKK